MMKGDQSTLGSHPGRWHRWRLAAYWGGFALLLAGCGSVFNPAFTDLIDPTGQSATLDNTSGHVIIAFVNNAEVDEGLVDYLTSTGGLDLTNTERRALRPRIRMRVLVTFTNNNTNIFEFVSGSRSLIDQNFDAEAFPDLNQNDLDNVVVLCDVARVEVDRNSPIEVFIPVQLIEYRSREIETQEGGTVLTWETVQVFNPQFRPLIPDIVDADGNTILRANIDIRDLPGPVVNPGCGGVVTIVLNGVLSVPFLTGVDDDPSFDGNDLATLAGIGGRYEFMISVR